MYVLVSESEIVTDKTAENAQPQENNEETPINMAPRVPPKTPFHQVALTPFNPSEYGIKWYLYQIPPYKRLSMKF